MPTYADSSIYSLIRPQQPMPDPVQDYAGMVQLKNLIRTDKDEEATRQAYQASGGDPIKLRELLYGSGQFKAAIAAEKAGLETQKTKSGIEKDKLDILANSFKLHRDQLSGVNDPQSAAKWVLSGFNDPNLSPLLQKAGSPEEVLSRIPQDPKGFADWKMRNGLGMEKYQTAIDAQLGRVVTMRGQDVTVRGQDKPIQITDAAGNTRLISPYTGETVKDLGAIGKPTATHEKTVAANKKLSSNLDEAIIELEKATADGGLIDKSTGSGIGAGVDWTASLFGKATPGSIAVGAMKPIFDLVLKMVPRFEGPQSDKDTQTYKEAAGELANPNVPNERKKIAGREILRLMKARKGQFISKEMEGTEVDTKPVVTNPIVPSKAGGTPSREEIDAELRRRGVIR